MRSPAAATPGSPNRTGLRRTMILMGMMMGGAGTVDAITGTMLPITAKHFTDNAALIAVMVALNRICGFAVQPYAAWKSDGHRSAWGRRRPFLLLSWPVTLICTGLLGLLPFVVPEAHARTVAAVVVLFVVNLGMQVFLDMCYGTADPLYGDMFDAGELGRANGIRMIVVNVIVFTMTAFFVPLADVHEFYPYLGAMLYLAISTLVAVFFLKEKIPASLPPTRRYSPLKPLRELANPQTRNVAIVSSAVLVALGLTEMLHALFVTETLGFSKTVLGLTTSASLVISLLCPYPLGSLVDRLGARRILIVGFLFLMAVELCFVLWVRNLFSLYACLILFKVAWLVVHVPIVPLIFQDTPPEKRGSIFAAIQMTRAAVTSAAVILAGFLVNASGSYRMCYLLAAAVCLIGLYGAMKLAPKAEPGGCVAQDA